MNIPPCDSSSPCKSRCRIACDLTCGKVNTESERRVRHWLLKSQQPYFFICQSDGAHDPQYRAETFHDRNYQRTDFMLPVGGQNIMLEVKERALTKKGSFSIDDDEMQKTINFADLFKAELWLICFAKPDLELGYWLPASRILRQPKRIWHSMQIKGWSHYREIGSLHLIPKGMFPVSMSQAFSEAWPQVIKRFDQVPVPIPPP